MVVCGWVETTIGSLVENKQVSIQTGPFGTVLSASEYTDHGIPVVSVREIRQGRIELYDETPTVSELTYHKLSQFALKPYDLVFARKGSVDRSALIPEDAQKLFLGSDGIRLRFVDPTLAQVVFHYVQSPQMRQFLTVSAYGTTMAGLNETIISSIPFSVPSDSMEQRLIAKALTDMDELIESLEKLIAKKKAIKQGLMQDLLTGKRRLPGFTGEWKTVSIGECGFLSKESINPMLFPTEYFWEYSMPAFDESKSPSRQLGKNMHSNRNRIIGNVLLFNKLNVRQKRIWLVNHSPLNSVCSTEFLPYYSDVLDLRFLKYILETDKVTNDFVGMSTGTSNSQKRITPDAFLNYAVRVPKDLAEQQSVADALEALEKECYVLEKELNKARRIKQGMMQQLLTGKIRLV